MDITPYLTPHKLGRPVLTGSGVAGQFDCLAVDCPTVFSHNGRFYMLFIGFDGIGYQTGLAVSDDLLHWEKQCVLFRRDSNADWDKVGQAGVWILHDDDLYSGNPLIKVDGKYWIFYHSYPEAGYETGPAKIGAAWCEDESLLDWHFLPEPLYLPGEADAWDGGGLYKCCVVRLGGKWHMYYNAKDQDGVEQTGLAVSDDLLHWARCPENPLVRVEPGTWTSRFCSDPHVCYDSRRKTWVMFFYGFSSPYAMDGVALSGDGLYWEKYPEPILRVGQPGELDCRYAHKPSVIYHDGKLYHYYCACRPWQEGDPADNGGEFRCITVAVSD